MGESMLNFSRIENSRVNGGRGDHLECSDRMSSLYRRAKEVQPWNFTLLDSARAALRGTSAKARHR